MAAQSASQGLEHELSDKPVVAIFSSRTCRHCKAAKSLLQDLGVVLQDVRADTSRNAPNLLHSITPQIDIGSRPEQRKTLSSYTQMTSVPQIFIGSRFIGGNDQLQELHSNGKLADLLTPRSPDTPPRWLADLLADCSSPQASADLEPAAVAGRLAALEDAPSTAASSYVMAVLQRTKLGQVAPLKAGIFQSDSTYKQPATIGPYMNSCTTLISLRDAFLEHGCSASAADGYTSFALHSGALVALNGLTKSASPCNKKWPLAVHSALRDFMVRGYLTPPPEAAADSAGVSSPEAGAGAASLEPGAGSFAVAQGMVQAAVARSHRSSLPNMMQSSLGLNATFESHVMPLVPNTEHDSAAAASPPSLDGPAGVPSSCSEEAGRAAAISAIFADCLDSVMEHIAPSGSGGYMYLGLQHSEVWKNYVRAAALLRRCCVPALSGDERKALFLNVYNGLMIHGMLFWGAPTTDKARWQFFGKAAYLIGGMSYSLDDVEHGVLRCNAPHPYRLQAQFGEADLRREAALQSLDPRVHFAMADLGTRTLQISRILYWFNKDFGRGSAGDVAHAYIKQYAIGAVGEALAEAERTAGTVKSSLFSSASKRADKWKVSFLEYDWGTNGVGLSTMIV